MLKRITAFFMALALLLCLAACASVPKQQSVRIAIIDTGISSAAISSKNLAEGRNYVLPQSSPEDGMGHGTAVSSIIVGSDSAGVEGLCPTAVLVPLVYYSKSTEESAIKGDLVMLAQIIRDAVDVYDCRIINISAGAKVDTPALRDAVAWAEQQGVLVVSCAGNDGDGTAYYPGAYPTVLCAGSLSEKGDAPAAFSNRHRGVDLLAPGIQLPAADIQGESKAVSGTSFSTAYLSGTAAALLTEDPSLTPYQLRRILQESADDIGDAGYNEPSGWGILNSLAAREKLYQQSSSMDETADAYPHDAMEWALKNGVLTEDAAFSSGKVCTRAEAITLLWRAMGSPEPRITKSQFPDVMQEDSCGKAVLWAEEKGIMAEIFQDSFLPNAACNEAEFITLLWRALNCPDAAKRSELAATLGEYYYTDAVAWADTQGLLPAVETGFAPQHEVSLGDALIYLYAAGHSHGE